MEVGLLDIVLGLIFFQVEISMADHITLTKRMGPKVPNRVSS